MLAGASGYASAGKCSNSFNHMFQPDGQTEKEIEKKEYRAKRALFQLALEDMVFDLRFFRGDHENATFSRNEVQKKNLSYKCGSEKRGSAYSSYELSRILRHEKPVEA